MTRSGGDFQPRPLKRLFTANQCWTSFLDAGGLRDIEVEAVTKMLACGTRILGARKTTATNLTAPTSDTSLTHAATVPARPAERRPQTCG